MPTSAPRILALEGERALPVLKALASRRAC